MRFFAMFAIVALAELATFLWVQSWIGLGWALLIALSTALIGSFLVRRAGIAVWRRFRRRVDRAELPGRELSDGAAVLVAGAFLISPGFITDLAGFLLLIPAVRARVHAVVARRLGGRVRTFTANAGQWPPNRYGVGHGGEVIDVDEVD